MKKIHIYIFIVYLTLGVLWSVFSNGLNVKSIRNYDGLRPYRNVITEVERSFIDLNGLITICVKGKLQDSIKYPKTIEKFSIQFSSLALNKAMKLDRGGMYVESKSSNWLYLSDSTIGVKCANSINKFQKVPVKVLNLEAKDVLVPWTKNQITKLNTVDSSQFTVFVIPLAYEKIIPKFKEDVQVIIVRNEADLAGRHYYEIKLKDSLITKKIKSSEYFWAYVKDIFQYPIQIISLLTW